MLIRKRLLKWLLLEFSIVFVGVYLAFLLSEWQEQRRDRKIQAKYYQSLIFEFEEFQRHLETEDRKLRDTYLVLLDAIDQGQRPDLLPPDLFYLYRGPVLTAAFNAKNFESLDLDLIHSIARGTFQLERLKSRIQMLNGFTQTILLPELASGKPDFFTTDGQLRQGFAWYPKLLREIHEDNRSLYTIVTDLALPDLRRHHHDLSKGFF